MYDWSPTMTGGSPTFRVAQVDAAAQHGAQTLYIQTARFRSNSTVLDEPTLRNLISRAHLRGMKVIGWYLPTFTDLVRDLDRIYAMKRLNLDGIAIDIEAQDVKDPATRTLAMVIETVYARVYFGQTTPMGAITMPPVHLSSINPSYWPGFPWEFVGQSYDAVLPMSYWTLRKAGSTYANPTRHIGDDVRLARTLSKNPRLAVHEVGGLAEDVTPTQASQMVAACRAAGCIGGSLYDATTTSPAVWNVIGAFRSR